ncbi:MAG: Type IV fimbrial assembly protein PilC [uncultured Thiotrichaceae bacterium]|uniref:Type IV fimbrial assembly protein PilC n=1 Tax=uncultured Thiotrichaceae bacterium TaxID=298394 RepID=A0A6S6TKP9_9GAMM|nr:MAG: Type IV fimbrial assembly protein PilC [uncultured Thiotrichaceae bacterium]
MSSSSTIRNKSSDSLETYTWEGVNRSGVKIKGETQANNANMLRATLRKQGINTKKVVKKPKPLFAPKIQPADIAHFARQMTTMLNSGVPMVQSLHMVASGGDNTSMHSLIKKIAESIEGGTGFGASLAQHPKYFDKLFVSLVKAGEQAGTLETMLDKVATYKEKSEALKSKIKKAVMYPVIVVLAAVVVSSIMLIWVIPQFKEVFSSFGADLPAFTLWVISLSEWLQEYWWMPLVGMIGAGFAFSTAKKRSVAFDRFMDRVTLKIPIIGNILNMASIARFCRTFATMFAAGVPAVEALDSVAGSTGNSVYYDATMSIKEDASQGMQINVGMQTTQLFPNMVVQMTRIGEESGRLEEMLARAADYYEEQVDDLVDTLAKQIEPLIMAVLGVVVGGLVIAMYLPIFKLGAVV